MPRSYAAIVAVIAASLLASGSAGAACRSGPRAQVPVERVGPLPVVTATLDGLPARLVLDTGAERTILAEAAVRALGLPGDPWVSSVVRGMGGVVRRSNVLLRSFTLGDVPLRRHAVNPVLSVAVAPIPILAGGANGEGGAAGLLGADYLSAFDLDLDLIAGTLGLYAARDCVGGAPPWATPSVAVPARRPRSAVLLVPVQIDGRRLEAQLDTGAAVSLITHRGAARLGLSPGAGGKGTIRGVGQQEMPMRLHAFADIRFGPLVLHDAHIAVGAPAGGFPFDMILGLDVLRDTRLWISYASNRVLVAIP